MKLTWQPWESKLLKVNVFSLRSPQILRLTAVDLQLLPRPCLVAARVKSAAGKLTSRLKKLGFYLIEDYQVYESPTSRLPKNSGKIATIRMIGTASSVACGKLAQKSFQYDRFHSDPNIDDHLADLSRASWIANALNGRALFVLGAYIDKKLVGFIDINRKNRVAAIDLIAVDVRYRRQDIAGQLIEAAKSRAGKLLFSRIQAGTQAKNLPAIGCYKKNDFKLIATYKTFHYYKS